MYKTNLQIKFYSKIYATIKITLNRMTTKKERKKTIQKGREENSGTFNKRMHMDSTSTS